MITQQTELTQNNNNNDNEEGNGRNWIVVGAGLIILIGLAIVFIFGLNPVDDGQTAAIANVTQTETQAITLPETGPPLQVGDLPYEFSLEDVDGNLVSLSGFSGQPVIINYWATWCGPCRIEMPHLQNTFETYQGNNLALLALNQDETFAEINPYFAELGLTFPALLDPENKTSANYGVGRTLPTTFFINPDGEITAIHRGPMTQSQIDGYMANTIPQS